MLSRPEFQAGGPLTASALKNEQNYLRQRLRNHERFLHGWGVVCGLQVVPAGDPARPWAIRVCPGFAITACGDPIEVCCSQVVDPHDWLWLAPDNETAAWVVLRYVETEVRPVAIPAPQCRCGEPAYGASRIRAGYRIEIRWQAPDPPARAVGLCQPGPVRCRLTDAA